MWTQSNRGKMKGPIALLMTLILLANFLAVGVPVAGQAEADVSEISVPENVSLDLLLEFKSTGRLHIRIDYSGPNPLYSLYSYLTGPVLLEVSLPVLSLQETSFAASSVLPGSDSILTAPAKSVGWEINIELTSPSEGTLTLATNGWLALPLTEEQKQTVSTVVAAYKLAPGMFNQLLLDKIQPLLTYEYAQYDLEITDLSITELDWDGAASKLTFGATMTAESSTFGAELRRELPMSITTTGTGSIPTTITSIEDLEGLTLDILFRLVSTTAMLELQMESAGVTSTIGLDFEFELRPDEMGVVTQTNNTIVVDFGVLQEYWPTSLEIPSVVAENEDVTFALRVPSGAEVENPPSGHTQTDTTYTWTGSSVVNALLALVTGEAGTRISYWVGPATVAIENIQNSVGQTIEVENNYVESVEIESERVINVNFEKDQPVSKVRVTLAVAIENIEVQAQRLSERPAGVVVPPAERGIVSHYLEMRTTASEQVESATVEFRVSKLWISMNDIDEDTVRLLRFGEGEGRWIELLTNFTDEDNLYLYYSATTTEFSYFTVVGQSVSPEREAAFNVMLVVGILAMVIGAFVLIFVVRSMRRSTEEISKSLKRLKAKS